MEARLSDQTTKAVDSDNGENVEDNVQAGQLVHDWHSHLHHHLLNDLEGLDFSKEYRDTEVAEEEGECKERGAHSVHLSRAIRTVELDISHHRHSLANHLKDVKLLVLEDSGAIVGEKHNGHLYEVNSSDGEGDIAPEARSDRLDFLELVV